MNNQRIEQLYAKCLAGSASVEQRREVLAWLALPENEQQAKEWLLNAVLSNDRQLSFDDSQAESMIRAILNAGIKEPQTTRSFQLRWIAYAAAAIILIFGGAYLYISTKQKSNVPVETLAKTDVLPGHQSAVLTLNDGKKIVLDSLTKGTIDLQNGAQATLEDRMLNYKSIQTAATGFNTISTPRGRKFDVRLSDGTHVWLNAASSVTFPVVFNASTREVKITGEAYLEVAQDKKPFTVHVDDKISVQVLGTSFNIKAYADEPYVQTTLITGAVKVTGNLKAKILRPGEQTNFSANGIFTLDTNADTDQVTAWKNGVFNFNKADIQTVMRELSRWYDIDIVYAGHIPKREFKGEIGSDLSLSQVLKGLKDMEVHFEIKGRTLTVMQ